MTKRDGQSPPLHVEASLASQTSGESGLMVASAGYVTPNSVTYREYVPSPGEKIERAAGRIATIAKDQGIPVISVIEGIPIVALSGEGSESIRERWQILKLMSYSGVIVERLREDEEKSPEELRKDIASEFERLFNVRFSSRHGSGYGSEQPVDWSKYKCVFGFTIRGRQAPAWLKFSDIDMSNDATIIKLRPDNHARQYQSSFDNPRDGRTLYISQHGGGTGLLPVDEPWVHRLGDGDTETLDEYYERMNGLGYSYVDLENHRLSELLHIMKQLAPPKLHY